MMKKNIISFLFILIFLISESAFADIPISYVMKVNLIMNDGEKIFGFYETSQYGGCKCLNNKSCTVLNDDFKNIKIDNIYALKILKKEDKVDIYHNLYPLYYSNQFEKYPRLSRAGVIVGDFVTVQTSKIKKVEFVDCTEIGVAGTVKLNIKEKDMLMQKSYGIFYDENLYSCGQINLISYNKNFNSSKDLENLLKNIMFNRNIPIKKNINENLWWDNACNKLELIKNDLEKKDIIFLNYHVTD